MMEFQVASYVEFGFRRETTQRALDPLISRVTFQVVLQIERISVYIAALVAFVPTLRRIHVLIRRHLILD